MIKVKIGEKANLTKLQCLELCYVISDLLLLVLL